jgi:hypothetical protein
MNTHETFLPEYWTRDDDAPAADLMIDFTLVLEDFMDEEVLDKQGATVGTLACYWPSAFGQRVFLGVKLKNRGDVHVVPGRRSQVDDRKACIRLGLEAAEIEAAPLFDCAERWNATIERTVNQHFHPVQAQQRREPAESADPSDKVSAQP